jgi:hypothetical protein
MTDKRRLTALLDTERDERHQRLWNATKSIEKGQQSEVIVALFEDTFDLAGPSSLGEQVTEYLKARRSGPPRPVKLAQIQGVIVDAPSISVPDSSSPSPMSVIEGATQGPVEGSAALSKKPRRESPLLDLTAGR